MNPYFKAYKTTNAFAQHRKPQSFDVSFDSCSETAEGSFRKTFRGLHQFSQGPLIILCIQVEFSFEELSGSSPSFPSTFLSSWVNSLNSACFSPNKTTCVI